jgi:hypothetical protein
MTKEVEATVSYPPVPIAFSIGHNSADSVKAWQHSTSFDISRCNYQLTDIVLLHRSSLGRAGNMSMVSYNML